MTIYEDIIQGTPEWDALRRGKFTASTFGYLFMAKTTKGYQEAINRVVFERIAGESPETYSNEFMKRGTELEAAARQAYELDTFNKIKTICTSGAYNLPNSMWGDQNDTVKIYA